MAELIYRASLHRCFSRFDHMALLLFGHAMQVRGATETRALGALASALTLVGGAVFLGEEIAPLFGPASEVDAVRERVGDRGALGNWRKIEDREGNHG